MSAAPIREGEPRWPAVVALMSAGGLFYALPDALKVGPDWLIVALIALFSAPGICLHRIRHRVIRIFGHAAVATATLAMLGSLTLLISRLPGH